MTENTDADESEYRESTCDNFVSLVGEKVQQSRRAMVPQPPCDACEIGHHDSRYNVTLGNEEYSVCEHCFELLENILERYNWWDRLTEAHYDRAAEFLHSLDEIWCVKDEAYAGGEMWVHTPFCDAAVVNDVCNHFDFRIRWFSVVYPENSGFDCVHDHGPCIEINLVFNNWETGPLPLEYDIIDDVTYHDVAWLEEYHKLFNRTK